ncbi:S-formylglutathione hydrolase [Pseudanabaena sp. FACHB-2040]|uniref:S-formylglutathione hydrolase n=1 Tax=Pseudanabaena sp. FACHB-2040 TaxID=2692859 RepID=UPI0016830FAF|nr:S-formylglutathione hydrolase [Pseudanabaena sp. FACHB-2040]MBD2257858.1 S-formylglutathione hydrolase [Pseudanabaena sp. FACHB-2040]
MTSLTLVKQFACFGGLVAYYSHSSRECGCPMQFAVFVPPQAQEGPVPVLYYLSGLTCTEDNFTAKAGAQRYAAEHGLMLVAPDTSPRGLGIPGEEDDWDFGTGAGFYVDATQKPWSQHYRMYSYVVQELPELIAANFRIQPDRQGIFGHSMGGHGALVCGLRNPDVFKTISAFAPICAPMQSPWGIKAFSRYLGADLTAWRQYDASELVKHHADSNRLILIDQGEADSFLDNQLMPQVLELACQEAKQPLTLRLQEGYDHSYFFISTFMADHIRHHALGLCQ